MRVRLKLSITHDMDLITLTQCKFPIAEWIKIALRSYVEDKTLSVIPLPEMPSKIRYEKCEINFSLHEVRDKSIIEWLTALRAGQRSGAIKTIFRCSLSGPCLAGHVASADDIIELTSKPSPSFTPSFTQSKAIKKAKETSTTNLSSVSFSPETEEDDDFDIFGFNPDR